MTRFISLLVLAGVALAPASIVHAATLIPLSVARTAPGAPLTVGLPFPKGALASPDHVRVLTDDGREVPSQVTTVTTWEPADPSVKWAWVFFFAEAADRYVVEFGPNVRRAQPPGRLMVANSQRQGGGAEIATGPLHLSLLHGEGGLLQGVHHDPAGRPVEAGRPVASSPGARGSFVDLVDDDGRDAARAVIRQTWIERGSGPLHVIIRAEGEYRYGRDGHAAAPFTLRVHAYAGQPWVRVLHTFVYTGVPDKHAAVAGEYPHIATQAEAITRGRPDDPGWAEPEDRLAAAGLGLALRLSESVRVRTSLVPGAWSVSRADRRVVQATRPVGPVSLLQTGPEPLRVPPTKESSGTARLEGFVASVTEGTRVLDRAERAGGWLDVSADGWGVAIGMRHMLEEYPKELRFDPSTGLLQAFSWSPRAEPMSFARASSEPAGEGAVENWAQGLAKTSEFALYFHDGQASDGDIARVMDYVLHPAVAHADPAWYGASGVYGRFAAHDTGRPDLERALDQRVEWVLFNRDWAPWYGMFDYGDLKQRYDAGRWDVFAHNEPAQDFQLWVHFMRTGDARVFDSALALSRHTMDVDNTHWPAGTRYRGDTNAALDYWQSLEAPPATKWLGVGRRHSAQHWMHVLSAHVWVQGWLASYYLAGEHRGLDVAIQTAEMHRRRLWGEHELTGRRLYLSAWNLIEVWDATKHAQYRDEATFRVQRMLEQQQDEDDQLALDRYGYAQVYATHALRRYLDLTGDPTVRAALLRHARRVRDVPPLNHWMESYLASQHALAVAYELSGERSFLDELARITEDLGAPALSPPIDHPDWTQEALAKALAAGNHLPPAPEWFRRDLPAASRQRSPNWSPEHGLRFSGWSHGLSLPWTLWALAERGASPRE